jgi:hypothetical protein
MERQQREERETVLALAANLFLQPSLVHALVHYFLQSHTPLDESNADRGFTRLDQLESDTRAMAQTLVLLPIDFVMHAQTAVIGPKPTDRPRVVGIFYWHNSAFAVRDDFFAETDDRRTVLTALGAMVAAPERYWDNVTHGGMIGSLVATSMRHMSFFRSLYSPALMLATMVRLLLERIPRFMAPDTLVENGPLLAAAIGRGLTHLHFPPDGKDNVLIAHMAVVLKDASVSFSVTCEKLKTLLSNLDKRALQIYASMRDKAGASGILVPIDLDGILEQHCVGNV